MEQNKNIKLNWRILLVGGLLSILAGTAAAGEARVVKAEAKALSGGGYSFRVTLAHADKGWKHYANKWQVLDPSGKRLGTVSQQNTIPKGSLNGPWGAIADAAAGAAADGIIKLLPKSS